MPATFKVPTIFSAIDKLTGPIKKMDSAVTTFAARAERGFRKVGDAAARISKTSFLIGSSLALPLGIAAKSAITFQERMSNVATLVDTSKENMRAMGNEVLNLASKIPKPIEELTTGLYDVRSAGIAAEKAMGVLSASGKLATAGLSTTAEATNIMTSAMNTFASEGLKADQIADILFKTVKAGKTTVSQLAQSFGSTATIIQSAGVKLADFQAATAALTVGGTPAAQAQTQLRAAIVQLQKPTAEMSKIFRGLGVTTEKELIQKFGGLGGAFKAVSEQAKKSGINTAKAWSSSEAIAGVTSIIGSANKAYLKTVDDMTKGANAVEEAFNKQLSTVAIQAQLARNNMQALSITIGTEVIPIIIKLLNRVKPMVQGFSKWAQENPGTLKTIVYLTAGVSGLSFVLFGVSGAVALVTKAIAAWSLVTKVATAAQWLLNAALTANPIGIIIIAIVGLIALVATIITKWNEWGAALSLILGPLGIIISLIVTFRKNWAGIVEAFRTGGIVAGLKAVGRTILEAILTPLQQVLKLISKVPGMGWADVAAKNIQIFRDRLGVNTEEGGGTGQAPAVNPKLQQQEALLSRETKTNNARVQLDVNDPHRWLTPRVAENNGLDIKLSSTMSGAFG